MPVTDRRLAAGVLLAATALPLVASAQDAGAGKSLEQRVERLERVFDSRVLMQMQQRIDGLEAEVADLRGQLEEQNHALENLKRRQRELYLDTDRRLQALEVAGSQPAPASGEGAGASGGAGEPGGEQADAGGDGAANRVEDRSPAEARADYDHAFGLLKEGRYAEAIEAFEAFLARHGQSEYADNAQYWKGEAFYVRRDFQSAIEQFQRVLDNYPASSKVPDALLKMGYAQDELGNTGKARALLRRVIEKAPESSAARLAQRRLDKIAGR